MERGSVMLISDCGLVRSFLFGFGNLLVFVMLFCLAIFSPRLFVISLGVRVLPCWSDSYHMLGLGVYNGLRKM